MHALRTGPLALLALSLLAGAPARAAPEDPSDREIADAVEDELLSDPAVEANWIDVTADQGVVTLSGGVPHLLARDRALRLAETVRGVRAVVDRTEILTRRFVSDATLRDEIRSTLVRDPVTEAFDVRVSVAGGVATLGGTVHSWQEFWAAERVAKEIPGVARVQNELRVEFPSRRPDDEIRAEILDALRWDVFVDASRVDVAVEDGAVTLRGTVGSAAERTEAVGAAWVAGVGSLDATLLTVDPSRDRELRRAPARAPTDPELRAAVAAALARDPRVDASRVRVEVERALVTLRGSVGTLEARRAAAADARHTVGVVGLENRLKVRWAEALADEEVAARVRQALEHNAWVGRHDLEVEVAGGNVRLTGDVSTYFERARAEAAAARVRGVVAVDNDLRVGVAAPWAPDPYVDRDEDPGALATWREPPLRVFFPADDEAIRQQIRDELFWSPFVDEDRVRVAVEDGVATLTGTASSWAERNAATENAFDGGARWVENRLVVEGAAP